MQKKINKKGWVTYIIWSSILFQHLSSDLIPLLTNIPK